jgi:hypothetical protein
VFWAACWAAGAELSIVLEYITQFWSGFSAIFARKPAWIKRHLVSNVSQTVAALRTLIA